MTTSLHRFVGVVDFGDEDVWSSASPAVLRHLLTSWRNDPLYRSRPDLWDLVDRFAERCGDEAILHERHLLESRG